MANSDKAEPGPMSDTPEEWTPAGPCRIYGCPGHYEPGTTDHVTSQDGQLVLIKDLSAEICTVCGDYVMRGSTLEQLDSLLDDEKPHGTQQMPVYAFHSKDTPHVQKPA